MASTSSVNRGLDVVIYGATGFTGSLIADYFASLATLRERKRQPPLRWAIAGRSESKLLSLQQSLPGGASSSFPKVLVADTTDPTSLDNLTCQTKVLLSAAGPYNKLGIPVVSSCIRNNTDYVDITGETPFVRRSMDCHNVVAEQNGTFVFHMCGFDSIPSDLGTFRTVRRVKELYQEPTRRVSTYVTMKGQLSGGTLESGIQMDSDRDMRDMLHDPFLLGGKPQGDVRKEDSDYTGADQFGNGPFWMTPFGMAMLNTRVVRRSAAELTYGPDFLYTEKMLVPNEKLARKLARSPTPVEKRVELRDAGRLPRPGQGPSPEERSKGWFKFIIVGEGSETGQKVVTSVSGGDPGYTETAKMVSEAALVLVETRDNMLASKVGKMGGVLTSAWMGDALVSRLQAAGIVFKDECVLNKDEDETEAVLAAMLQQGPPRAKLLSSML